MLFMIGAGVFEAAGHAARATAAPPRPNPSTGRIPPPTGVLTRLPGDGNQLGIDHRRRCQRPGGRRARPLLPRQRNSPHVLRQRRQQLLDRRTHQRCDRWSTPAKSSSATTPGRARDITRIGPAAVADQIRRNADFLRNTYGVDGTPILRPPYGRHTPATDRIAADQGYTTIAMWSGTIRDSTPISEAGMIAAARASFQPQQIVVGHANLPTITRCFPSSSTSSAAATCNRHTQRRVRLAIACHDVVDVDTSNTQLQRHIQPTVDLAEIEDGNDMRFVYPCGWLK